VPHEEAEVVFERLWDSVVVAEFDAEAVAVVVGDDDEETLTVTEEVGEIEVDPLTLTLADEQLDALGDDVSLGLPEIDLEATAENVLTEENDRVGETVAVVHDVLDAELEEVDDTDMLGDLEREEVTQAVAETVKLRVLNGDLEEIIDAEDTGDTDAATDCVADELNVRGRIAPPSQLDPAGHAVTEPLSQ
jgi:hypothetical protein